MACLRLNTKRFWQIAGEPSGEAIFIDVARSRA
jgi:hypothetical protein